MNRVDLAVPPAFQVVGLQVAVRVNEVVALPVVVLDLQIAVEEQALCDDEVMRLVAVRENGREPPRRQARCDRGRRERDREMSAEADAERGRRTGERPSDDERRGEHDDDARERAVEEQERRRNRTGDPRQPRDQRQPQRRGVVSAEPERGDDDRRANDECREHPHRRQQPHPRRRRLARDRDDAKRRPGAGSPRERRRDGSWLHTLRLWGRILPAAGCRLLVAGCKTPQIAPIHADSVA